MKLLLLLHGILKITLIIFKMARVIFKIVSTILSWLTKVSSRFLAVILDHKIESLYILAFIGLQIMLYRNWPIPKYDPSLPTKTTPIEALAYKCCIPLNNSIRTNIFFLKTHKTASTTIQSVLLRFAKMNSLDVMDIKYESYYWPLSDSSIHSASLTPNSKYHILAQHTRYDPKLKSYQYPNTSMVTILRHPAKLFQSIYTYFKMDTFNGISFENFLNLPVKPPQLLSVDGKFAYRGYNQMSVDLGFDWNQSNNNTAIVEFIEKIDRDFDLVMITEYVEASMILLANLMGWPLEYVAYFKLNTQPPGYESYKLTLHDESTLMDLNQVDTLLYYYFRKKFRKCVQQYGEDKMRQQVQQLRIINKQLKERCVADEVVVDIYGGHSKTMLYIAKNLSDVECVYSTTPNFGLNIPPELIQMFYSFHGSKPSNEMDSDAAKEFFMGDDYTNWTAKIFKHGE